MDSKNIRLPGFGLPLDVEEVEGAFPSAIIDWTGYPLTVRERTMMSLMNVITDKPDWDRKVFDENITRKWRQEALEDENMDVSERMLDWTFAELQDKAISYQKDGMSSIFDTDVAVIKSDTAIPPQLTEELRAACLPLENVHPRLKDWHPGSDGKVLDLVHPSLFPLIYGRSTVVASGRVSLQDCVESIGKGETIPIPKQPEIKGEEHLSYSALIGHSFSQNFQWLPCQVGFTERREVKITSYINNLHPAEHGPLYRVLERCIEKSLPLWDKTLSVLALQGKPRIESGTVEYDFPKGREVPSDFMPEDTWEREERWERETRVLIQPEPKQYTPMKSSINTKYGLKTKFKDSGLQVIVKLANIELTSDKPDYEGGSWHIEGQMNERICASALYYYDSDNVTESLLAFRHLVDNELEVLPYEQDDYDGIETVYGVEQNGPRVQELGRVSTRQGRLIAFPNVLQHRVLPFSLQDKSRPGHRKILALFLVDPHIPILSTANVPPQQKEWWSDKLRMDRSLAPLPTELEDQVFNEVESSTMTLDEAKKIRLQLMEERKAMKDNAEQALESYAFSFCEH